MNTRTPMPDPESVPESLAELVALFEGDLAGARFPDVDAESLRGWLERTQLAAESLSAAREQLELAKHELDTVRSGFLGHARLAISYAQIYAGDDGELQRRLTDLAARSELKAPRKRKAPEPRTAARKRTRRSAANREEEGPSVADEAANDSSPTTNVH
ncbi:MAG: hypothetical protein B7733_19305 [Myxococcales bacterium FL481]|nr:MAG: hypothetical protein B7733_19305 [Myxococcales bacterium FL481]